MRPPFIRVVPAEVDRYGAHGAVLLAHIRFRCESDGPGRITVEGVRWWRVSLAQLAQETGLSGKGVRTALRALGDDVAARHFTPLSDQTLAYRVADCEMGPDLPVAENGKWADLPVAENGKSVAEIGISSCPNGHLQLPKTASVPISGEARAGGEHARAGEPSDKLSAFEAWETAPPENLSGKDANGSAPNTLSGKDAAPNGASFPGQVAIHPLPKSSETERHALELANTLSMDPPDRSCTRHPDWDGPPCPACGNDREAFQAWASQTEQLVAVLERIGDQSYYRDQERAIVTHRKARREALQKASPA